MLPRFLLASLLLVACAETDPARDPRRAQWEREQEEARLNEAVRADALKTAAEAKRREQEEAVQDQIRQKRLDAEAEAKAKEQAAAPREPCVYKVPVSDTERARWDGARWVEENCTSKQGPPEVQCRPICAKVLPCKTWACPAGTKQEWIDLANQKICGGVREHQRAMLVDDDPCPRASAAPLPQH